MRVGLAFVAGVIGWAVMVGGMVLLETVGATDMSLCMIVGTLFTGQTSAGAWVLGFVIGSVISGLIALIYAAVFESFERSNWRLGAIGGAIHAAVGGIFFAILSSFHPAMPAAVLPPGPYGVNYGVITAVAFVILHLCFGAIVGGVYQPLHVAVPPRAQPTPEEQTAGIGPGTKRKC